MLHHRLVLIAVAAAAMAACAPVSTSTQTAPSPAAPPQLTKAKDFEAAIERLSQDDPESPEMLNLRLDYADFLASTEGPDCQSQLDAAQTQLDMVAASPTVNILLAQGPARIADDQYKIHLARAGCGSQAPLQNELQEALQAAQHAVQLYRDGLDYQSAAIMQFNVAATYQQLDDADAAVAALRAAIAMDRDYGLRKDAEDNNTLLLQWTTGKASDTDVAALMKDFPARTLDFKFAWPDSDADVTIIADDVSAIHGSIIESHAATEMKRHIRMVPKSAPTVTDGKSGAETADATADVGWTVTNEPGSSSYDMGHWPGDKKGLEWPTLYFLASALLQAPGIEIDRDGEFHAVTDPQAFAAGLATQVSAEISSRVPHQSETMQLLSHAFLSDFIESKAEQDYGLQTATWIGAKLQQGVWYQMSTPIYLPGLGLGHYLVQHDISFAFTREVPCTAQAPNHLCAEIVIHATPDANDLKNAIEDADSRINFRPGQSLHVWPRMDMRLVVDPDTLLPYVCDTRQSWYDSLGKTDPLSESIRTVATSVYR